MKPMTTGVAVALVLLLAPAVAAAGQIYGTIVQDGKGLKDLAVEIRCGSNDAVSTKTAPDGGYRMNVPQQGQCTLTLPAYEGKPSAMVFSASNPSAYNFQIVKGADGKYELKRRS